MTGRRPDPVSHVAADQSAVARLLSDPRSFADGAQVDQVERCDTHGSMVFLAGARAYKVKRAVDFPYMDFATLEKRRRACEAELTLNRRSAPELYLGVCPIVRDRDGLRLGALDPDGANPPGDGEVVEWAVVMRRFPQDRLLDRVAAAGALDTATVDALAAEVARFHTEAETAADRGAAALAWVIDENADEFPEHPGLFPADAVAALTRDGRAALARVRSLLDERAAAGLVRRCHGDLHMRNVVLLDGRPRLFDAIEFNDDIACIDVLYDLAFLLMDLDRRDLRRAANRLLNGYLSVRDDLEGLAALPLFLSLRAAIRAKVDASALAAQQDDTVRAGLRREIAGLFQAARDYLRPAPARLVAVGGVSGTGKTTLARALAPELGLAPGALIFRSDVERKRIFGVDMHARLPESAYRGAINKHVYDQMLARAGRALAAGRSVIVEATFLDRASRAGARRLAESAGVRFDGLWLRAPAQVLKSRVEERRGDASDATATVVEAQLARAPRGEIAWPPVDATGEADEVAARARQVLAGEAS